MVLGKEPPSLGGALRCHLVRSTHGGHEKTKFISLLLATAALAATSSSAVTVTGATRIRVTNALPNPDYVQIAELQPFDFNGVNVALAANGGTASGNPSLPSNCNNGFCDADNAIDGDTNWFNGGFHSDYPASAGYFEVSFAAANLASLTIFGRPELYMTGRDAYNVTIFNGRGTTFYSGYLDGRDVASVSTTFTAGGVPEPASWAMLIAGFGLTGAAARRRRRMVAVAA